MFAGLLFSRVCLFCIVRLFWLSVCLFVGLRVWFVCPSVGLFVGLVGRAGLVCLNWRVCFVCLHLLAGLVFPICAVCVACVVCRVCLAIRLCSFFALSVRLSICFLIGLHLMVCFDRFRFVVRLV